jgi:nitric oxide reductase NorE protein
MTTTEDATGGASAEGVEHVPGDQGIWFFVFFESLIFTSYFCVYLFSRTQHERAFLRSQSHLLLWLGILDTIALLTSSWAMARCMQHVRAGRHEAARRLAWVTAGLGVVFLALKLTEWVRLVHDGYTFTSSDFMQYYFFLTGIHAIHLLIGFVALGVLLYRLSDPTPRARETVDTCATYWHTVDLFWVVIFAMLYIVR